MFHVRMTDFCILEYTSACGKATYNKLLFIIWLSPSPPAGGCQIMLKVLRV